MCIGNTLSARWHVLRYAVYPYVYREHKYGIIDKNGNERFIPMCIGNTKLTPGIASRRAVYPYVYREHTISAFASYDNIGLSLCV